MATDETTPLRLSEPDRSYVYMSARNRAYRSKVRQFQCCVCAGLLGTFVVALVITVSYMVNHDTEDEVNGTTVAPDLKLATFQPQPELQRLLTASWPLPDVKDDDAPSIPSGEVDAALQVGVSALGARDEMEKQFPPVVLSPTHPSSLHRKAMYSTAESAEAARIGTVLLAATKSIQNGKSTKWKGKGPRLPPSYWMSAKWCPAKDSSPVCPPAQFRTIDGTCNNLENPDYGVAMRPFRRALPAVYGDGISSPRRAKDGSELPSAREVSLTVHRPVYSNDPHFTVVLAVWGQFVDHDFTATALSQRKDGSAITCCNNGWQHPECFPVHLAAADPFYTRFNVTCIDFVRSASAPTCALGPREQLNQVTPYIDGSVVYGGHADLTAELREWQGGRLASTRAPDGRELLPVDKKPGDGCNQASESARGRYCFKSGDARGNENLHLTTLHLIMQRQHNRLATQLQQLNPMWNDERIYQESRRIVAAQMQHITYNEFLPIVIGQDLSDELNLTPEDEGYYHGYDPSANPQIANEFAASAFRFGHTLLQGLLKMIANDTSSGDYVQLHKMLFNPFGLYDSGYLDKTMRGALQTDIQKPGPYFTQEVKENLFKPKAGPCGLDLVSLNVQRGRDHGLAGYPAWRERCGFSRPMTFDDLESIMDSDTVERMRSMYHSVDDIDMYTGIVSENPMEASGILGPTATCIITDQFVRLKRGDRYWYETPEQPQAFTLEQLNEVRKTTLSSLVCDNTDELEEIQPWSMRAVTPNNPMTACKNLPRPDISAWSETPRVNLMAYRQVNIRPAPILQEKRYHTAEENYHYSRDLATHTLKSPAASYKSLAIGASVMSGSITGSYSDGPLLTLWDGGFPVAIPAPFLDYPLPEGETLPPLPTPGKIKPVGGVLWDGSIEVVSANTLRLSANYHLPITMHGKGSFEEKWWSGEANLDLSVNWNSSDLTSLPEANYFSQIGFKNIKNKPSYEKNKKLLTRIDDEIGVRTLQASVDRPPLTPYLLPHLPIMLQGEYSPDNTVFYWNGNLTVVFPHINPPMPSLLTASASSTKSSSNAFGGRVSEGKISDNDGNIIWDGTTPQDISIPQMSAAPSSLHSSTTMMTAMFDTTIPGTINVNATFSVPTNDDANPGTLAWVNGNLEASVDIVWNSSNIASLPTTYTTMLCMVVFRNTKQLKAIIDGAADDILTMSNSKPIFNPQALIILDGEFIDAATFRWDGTVAFILLKKDKLLTSSAYSRTRKINPPAAHFSKQKDNKLVVGATVVSGTITGSYSAGPLLTLWSGDFPATLHSPFLDYPMPAGEVVTALPDPKTIEHRGGALWGGSIKIISSNMLRVSANYHLPIFLHGDGSFEQKWWCGEVDIDLQVNWKTSQLQEIPEQNFFSPIWFRRTRGEDMMNHDKLLKMQADDNSDIMLQVSVDRAPLDPTSVPRFPILLHGQYNDKNSAFFWGGNVTLIFPDNLSSTPKPVKITPIQPEITTIDTVKPPSSPTIINKTPYKPKPKQKRLVISARVVSGTITGSYSAGPLLTLWNGGFPKTLHSPFLDYPMPAGEVVISNPDPSTVEHRGGALWGGSVKILSSDMLRVSANYHLPIFLHGNSSFEQKWWCGEVDVELQVNWNTTDLREIPEQNFFSPIWFRKLKSTTKNWSSYKMLQASDDHAAILKASVDRAPLDPTSVPRFPVMLHGVYSKSNSEFSWDGNVTIIFPDADEIAPPKPLLSAPTPVSGSRVVIGGKVVSGKVSLDGGSNYWDGNLPFDVTLPTSPTSKDLLNGGNTVLSASFDTSTTGTVKVKGLFSTPVSSVDSLAWLSGSMDATVQVAWNFSDVKLLPSTPSNVYCMIYLQDGSTETTLDLNQALFLNSKGSEIRNLGAPATMPQGVIILLGTYNHPTSFTWNGDLTFIYYPTTPKKLLTSAATKQKASNYRSRLVLGGTVSAGKITAFSAGMPENLWFDGSLPVPIPMPAFDRYLPPGTPNTGEVPTGPIFHGHGILWRGNVDPRPGKRQIEIYGDFRLPVYEHGDVFSQDWFQGHVEMVIDVAWNSASLENSKIASPKDSDFFSPIRFRTDEYVPDGSYDYNRLQAVDPDMLQATPVLANTNSPYFPKFPMSKLPIILHGSMNKDRSAFLWSGNVTMVFPVQYL